MFFFWECLGLGSSHIGSKAVPSFGMALATPSASWCKKNTSLIYTVVPRWCGQSTWEWHQPLLLPHCIKGNYCANQPSRKCHSGKSKTKRKKNKLLLHEHLLGPAWRALAAPSVRPQNLPRDRAEHCDVDDENPGTAEKESLIMLEPVSIVIIWRTMSASVGIIPVFKICGRPVNWVRHNVPCTFFAIRKQSIKLTKGRSAITFAKIGSCGNH